MPGGENDESYEQEHVHDVYEQIAEHFSSTRYKPWPTPHSFLLSLPPGSIGLDVGCGNGKYLSSNPSLFILASDRSANLAAIAASNYPRQEVSVADGLRLPYTDGRFDFAISVAVVHHFSTRERRVAAIESVLSCLREGGRGLVVVWALEQESSRRGWGEGDEQDVMVPWVTRKRKDRSRDQGRGSGEADVGEKETEKTFNRYYHLYRKGELEEEAVEAGGKVLESGYEKDNWWTIISR
ncbi:S-adenosyl-L-methionine-dependent methyltransferase [Eremomyces bilateralis CBS 781.70]|uniref:S-adenosyl-L-methionine-dependent methyltransferase n=1 Tax=Eremomyces bilateralis CBS 781.70 TaxID=1392243 RepID=A0A6G1FWT7_9PEZI|nr:S-adenosyl-L-methionine-dependent methyltransferase [Eremomyces bilateralis CBS 781.70]KAF1810151.1 S-adenosyl-L-methionine-dependent methyltransferase [Eremomyces bilateralis CBS 781.70]